MAEPGHWKDYVSQEFTPDGYSIKVDTTEGPENVSSRHFFKQIILACELDAMGATDIELEHRYKGIRYDLYCHSPNGRPVVGEVGDLNTPSRKLIDRFETTYENADALIWWLKDEWGYLPPGKYLDVIEDHHSRIDSPGCCEICFENRQYPEAHSMHQFHKQFEERGWIYWFFLDHMFEPGVYHSDIESKQKAETES